MLFTGVQMYSQTNKCGLDYNEENEVYSVEKIVLFVLQEIHQKIIR